MSENVITLRFRYKYLGLIILIFVIGLLMLIASQFIVVNPVTHEGEFWKIMLQQIATAFLVGASTGGLYEYFVRKEFVDNTEIQTKTICEHIKRLGTEAKERAEHIADYFAANAEQRELGISHCFNEVDTFDFSDIIEESDHLFAVMNDGRGWTGNYYQRFVNRFKNGNKETTLILMHPNSPAIDVHAHKVGSTPDGLRMKIAETIRLLNRANTNGAKINIYGHDLYNTMSVFVNEELAIFTPYFLAKVRRTPPVMTFTRGGMDCMYEKMKEDIQSLLLDCVDISTYTWDDGRRMEEPVEQSNQADGK